MLFTLWKLPSGIAPMKAFNPQASLAIPPTGIPDMTSKQPKAAWPYTLVCTLCGNTGEAQSKPQAGIDDSSHEADMALNCHSVRTSGLGQNHAGTRPCQPIRCNLRLRSTIRIDEAARETWKALGLREHRLARLHPCGRECTSTLGIGKDRVRLN